MASNLTPTANLTNDLRLVEYNKNVVIFFLIICAHMCVYAYSYFAINIHVLNNIHKKKNTKKIQTYKQRNTTETKKI